MSGIVGYIDFSKNNIDRIDILHSMLSTVSLNNDLKAVQIKNNVALGMSNRQNRIVEMIPSRSNEKVFESDNRSIVFDGTIYNEAELKNKILATGYNLKSESTCELILASYEIWKLDCFMRFDGVYAISIWDDKLQELILARDILGVQPLYYYQIGETTCFGSIPKAILAHPEALAEVNIDGLRNIFTFVKTPEHGIFRNMFEVMPGTALRIHKGSNIVHKFWSLQYIEHKDDLDTTIDTIQSLLEQSITRRMPSASIQLSGGLDSSVILSMASRLNGMTNGERINTFSAKWIGQDFKNGIPEDFYIEEENVKNMSQRMDTIHTNVVVDVIELLNDKIRNASVNARSLPTGLGDMDMLYYLFFQGISNNSWKSLSGEGADELFGGYSWFYAPRTLYENKFPFSTINKFLETGDSSTSTSLLDPDLLTRLKLHEFESENYLQAIKLVPKTPCADPIEQRLREVSSLHMTHWTPILLDRRDRISRALGIEVHLPFCDQKLIEYVYNIPWKMKKFDNSTKSLLRAVAKRYLPEAVVYQRKSSWVANQPKDYEASLRNKLVEIIRNGKAPVLQLLDKNLINNLLNGNTYPSTTAIGGVLRLNNWLETYNVCLV